MYFTKKHFWILPCAAALIFSGCSKNASDKLNIEKNVENDVIITENGQKYEAHVTNIPEGITSIAFKTPENLAGVTFEYKNGKYIISSKELSGEYNLNPLEKNAIFSKIMDVFGAIGASENIKVDSEDDNALVFKIKTENSEYKILADKDGKILLIENPEENFKVEFKV